MAHSSAQILQSIPGFVAAKDAAALVALQDHEDREIRKSARKAIHTLRSKGVTIPAPVVARAWSAGDPEALRGDISEAAMIDSTSSPGFTNLMIAAPKADGRGFLWVAALSGRDQVANFTAYVQTDGQRGRLIREWTKDFKGRQVPADWARARIRWAREHTLSTGFSVPTQLDDMLVHLGPAPAVRPASFLVGQLPGDFKGARDNVEAPLMAARALAWPPLFDVEPTLKKVNDAHPNMSAETPESERYDALMAAVVGDTAVREALQGTIANLLEDASTNLWLNGHDEPAAQLLALAGELRSSDAAETLPWVGRLLGFQIATTLAYIQRQQQQQQQRQAG
jgi:hypothetical protein